MEGEKRDLLVIGKSKNPRCFKGVQRLPVNYDSSQNAWMTSVIFNNWLLKWDLRIKRKIVLVIDQCTAHRINMSLKNIKVIYLPSNTTSLIQPCDQGIIRTLKAYYRKEICARIITELDNPDPFDANEITKAFSLLDALHLVAKSWKLVTENSIINCFKKSGFLKLDSEFQEVYDVASDILDQQPDGMSKEEFDNWLDIDNDAQTAARMTTSDICQSVIDSNIVSRNNEDKIEKEEILETPPTDSQMQEALKILRRGVQHRATNFQKHYEYEQFIRELLDAKKCQKTLDEYLK